MAAAPPRNPEPPVLAPPVPHTRPGLPDRDIEFRFQVHLPAVDYDLGATLDSGQAFRWRQKGDHWEGILGHQRVRLKQNTDGILAATPDYVQNWDSVRHFLQVETPLPEIVATFPADAPMTAAVTSCRGLRLLRQDPWECLASFILSSTKQIVQIRQIIELLCERFGDTIPVPQGAQPAFAFPSPAQIAAASEADLRACKMGFRAPSLRAAARAIDSGTLYLESLRKLDYAAARERLMTLHGVGGKIADCVLLFAYGFDSAFPLDVWVKRALQELYFPKRRVSDQRLEKFSATHFGPHAGYAQQYLFHYMRTKYKSHVRADPSGRLESGRIRARRRGLR
jgi:N-glycosylase/DNA lyase